MADETVRDFASHSIQRLNVSPEVKEVLVELQLELTNAYRDNFVEMTAAISKQASVLDRIQQTLEILVHHLQPSLAKAGTPAAFRIARDGEEPDVASALMVADPIAAGYYLSVTALAEALGIPATDVSTLLKAFKLNEDETCAVVVRKGKQREITNYHHRVIARFLQLIDKPPTLDGNGQSALNRAKKKLLVSQQKANAATAPAANTLSTPTKSKH